MSDDKLPEEKSRESIDSKLKKAGWEKLESDSGTGYIEEYMTGSGPADYVLIDKGKPVAVVEAKRDSKSIGHHRQQARDYARDLNEEETYSNQYSVPFIFVANSDKIVLEDLRRDSRSHREISGFYSPEDIRRQKLRKISEGREWLKNSTYEDTDSKLWENQQEALKEVKKAILDKKDKVLVSMATGSGKTRLAMALTYQLLDSEFVNRVLFVPDTVDLADDTLEDFRNYNPIDAGRFNDDYIVGDFDEFKEQSNTDVVVSTIQKAKYELSNHPEDRSPAEFDVIIVDEAHRGVYNDDDGLGEILQFYDSIELGLTATPHKKTVERYNGNHVYRYSYDEALDDDHVVPLDPHIIRTKVTMDGITHEGTHYSPEQFGKDVLIHDTHKKVARELVEQADMEKDLTLVFAQNIDHAKVIADDFREVLGEELDIDTPQEFVKTIVGEDRHADKDLQLFKKKRRNPKVAVTVDMVTTGVDVRPLKNLVFLRAVKSDILFNQMIGRGTRNTDDKSHFNVFDCIGVFDHHGDLPPFNLENKEVQFSSSQSDSDNESGPKEDPTEIEDDDIDRIVESRKSYPLKNGFVSPSEYIESVQDEIYRRADEIKKAVESSETVEEADDKIQALLKEDWEYYDKRYIMDASDKADSIFALVVETLEGHGEMRKKAERAKNETIEKFEIKNENEKWIEELEKRATIEKETISKEDLTHKPFSNYGGYDQAIRTFGGEEGLENIISYFNKQLLQINTPNSSEGTAQA